MTCDRFVNMYENYRVASREVSQSQSITNKCDKATPAATPTTTLTSHKPYCFFIINLFNFNKKSKIKQHSKIENEIIYH